MDTKESFHFFKTDFADFLFFFACERKIIRQYSSASEMRTHMKKNSIF